MGNLRANEVFKPGSFPEYTYVTRKSEGFDFTYEMRLEQALNTPGYLTSIVGPSKTGKTVLCEKVIGIDKIVSLTGNDFRNQNEFWEIVAKKVGMSFEGKYAENVKLKSTQTKMEEKMVTTTERYLFSKDKVIQFFKDNELVLIVDDFHYASEELQFDISFQLKDAIRKEFKAIVISLPHRADDSIRKNPDLSGRLNLINIEPWKEEELKEIAIRGFGELHIEIDDLFASALAGESLTSPQLMQSICLNLSFVSNIDKEQVKMINDMRKLEESYRFTTINLPFQEVVKKLIAGPNTRGQRRKKFQLNNDENKDVYYIILKAISADPPSISISLDNLKQRVSQLLAPSAERIERTKIKDTLDKLRELMQTSEQIYQVFDWKDNRVFILDPLFLFYLRWGKY